MTDNVGQYPTEFPDARGRAPPGTGASSAAGAVSDMGLGGNTLSLIMAQNCPELRQGAGVVIEQLDAQAGAWEFSLDEGKTWRAVRTDLINRPGNTGLALDNEARLRVLPIAGQRVRGVRVAFHTVDRAHGANNGNYRAYVTEEREGGSASVTAVLSLSAVNGIPPKVHVPRPRNKRLLAQNAASKKAAAGAGVVAEVASGVFQGV